MLSTSNTDFHQKGNYCSKVNFCCQHISKLKLVFFFLQSKQQHETVQSVQKNLVWQSIVLSSCSKNEIAVFETVSVKEVAKVTERIISSREQVGFNLWIWRTKNDSLKVFPVDKVNKSIKTNFIFYWFSDIVSHYLSFH